MHVKEAQLELIVGNVNRPKASEGKGKDKDTTSQEAKEAVAQKPQKKGTPVTAVIRGHVEVDTGDVKLKFKVAAAITKPANEPISYFVFGQIDCENFSIGQNVRRRHDQKPSHGSSAE